MLTGSIWVIKCCHHPQPNHHRTQLNKHMGPICYTTCPRIIFRCFIPQNKLKSKRHVTWPQPACTPPPPKYQRPKPVPHYILMVVSLTPDKNQNILVESYINNQSVTVRRLFDSRTNKHRLPSLFSRVVR